MRYNKLIESLLNHTTTPLPRSDGSCCCHRKSSSKFEFPDRVYPQPDRLSLAQHKAVERDLVGWIWKMRSRFLRLLWGVMGKGLEKCVNL